MKRELLSACSGGLDSLQAFLHSFSGACRELTVVELESFSTFAPLFEQYPQNGFESLEKYARRHRAEGTRDFSDLPEYDEANSEARALVRTALESGNAMAALYHVLCYETLVRQIAAAKLENAQVVPEAASRVACSEKSARQVKSYDCESDDGSPGAHFQCTKK